MANKKAFIASGLMDFYAYMTFILVIIVFFVLFSLGKGEIHSIIKGESGHADTHALLVNYLSTPIEHNGKTITMSDLIILYAEDKSLYNKLETKTAKMLKDFFPEDTTYGANLWLRLMPLEM